MNNRNMFCFIVLIILVCLTLMKCNSNKHNSVTIVLAKYNEDIRWTSRLEYPYIIYSKHPNEPNYVAIGRDTEASSYLYHIINNYDQLSEWTLFMHAHETHWHHPRSAIIVCNRLNFSKLYKNGIKYHTLNHNEKGEIQIYENKEHQPSVLNLDEYLHVCSLIFNANEIDHIQKSIISRNGGVKFPPAAQFVVHRTRIRMRPKEFYEKCLYLLTHPLLTQNATNYSRTIGGFLFEALWHFIFGEPFIYVPAKTNLNALLKPRYCIW